MVKEIVMDLVEKKKKEKKNTFHVKDKTSIITIGAVPLVPRHQSQKERQAVQRLKRPRG